MKVYSLTQVGNLAEVGCYGVFSTPAKATEYAIEYAQGDGENIQKKPYGMDSLKKSIAVTMNLKFGNTSLTKPFDPIWVYII